MNEYIHEPILVNQKIFFDHRGSFAPLSLTSHLTWLQSNISINLKKFTLRGLHFQLAPYEQSKLIKLINGKVIDFVADIRETSNNYMQVKMFEMTPGDELYVPKGFAHGFITLEDNTIVQYLVDNIYYPISEGVIPWFKFPDLINKFESLEGFSIESLIIKDQDLIIKNFNL